MASKEEQIIEAMQIVTKKLIAAADFDRTIQATIVSCEDASIGKYKLRYQDGSFYAFSSSPDLKYSKGKTVYVLVPGNDMSRDKTILGGTDKVAPASINTMENLEAYEILGNIVSMVPGQENSFGLHSYKKDGEEIILYNKDDDSQNKININEAAFLRYLDFDKEANKIALRAKFTTKLPTEQQTKGNFGVKVTIKIADAEEKDFFLDVDNMIGQPYKQTNVLQEVPYDLPELKNNVLIEIKRISIFCENFPHFKTENLEEDIFIKDFKIDCISLLPSDQIETGYITLLAEPKDGWDDASNEFFKAIRYTAQLQFGNNKVNSDEQSLRYFWFKQNASIDNASPEYYSVGGRGWECLNKYNEDEKGNREWVSNSFYWFGRTEDSYDPTDMEYDGWIIPATDLDGKYKVVIIYNDTTYVKEFTIHNIHQKNRISLVNTGGDTFRWGNGYTDLECHIEDKDDSKIYNYYWNYSDSNGITAFEPSEDDKSKYRAYAVDILNHRTFSCTVYEKTQSEEGKGKCIGTDSVTIYNFNEDENGYLLEIINGKQAFQYDNNGVSPCNVNNVVPQNTLPLSFNLYDEDHNEINDFSNWTIRWKVPATDTLISISKKDISILEEKDGYYYINAIKKNEGGVTEKLSLPFAIANEFNYNFTNNNIELIANDEPTPDDTEEEMTRILVSASTDFFINKMGAAGTHGDEYVAKLCLKSNTKVGLQYLLCRIFTEDNKVFGQINNSDVRIGDTVSTEGLFTPTLYNLKTNQIITNELNSVKFEFLTLNKEDISFYNITKDGRLSLNLSDKTITKDNLSIGDKIPNHLLKCSFVYNNKTFFTIIPIITIISQKDNIYLSDVNIEGKNIVYNKNYGFYFVQYTSDGNEPQYDSNNPFYINIDEEQALSYNYKWGVKGSNLDYEKFKDSPKNQKFYEPKSVYKDGSVNNAVYCNVTDELNTTIAEVHIPIYFYKNTYGMDMLNEWDGTTLKINDEGGYILSPIVGAGKKDSEKNTFTGVLMGEVKEANKKNPDIGIMGYADGKRTFFVDAEDGHAQFGYNGNGITIDPTRDEALIYNRNFWQNSNIDTESGLPKDYKYRDFNGGSIEERTAPKDIVDKGMIINLTNPDIYMVGSRDGIIRNVTDISDGEMFSTKGKIGSLYYGDEGLTTGYNADENIRILTKSGSYIGRNLQIADNTPLGLGGYISLKSEKDDDAEKTILYRSYIEMEDGHFADYDSNSNQTLLMHMDTAGEGHIGSISGKVINPESAAAQADVELVLAKAKGTNEKGVYVQDGQGNLVNIYAKNLDGGNQQNIDNTYLILNKPVNIPPFNISLTRRESSLVTDILFYNHGTTQEDKEPTFRTYLLNLLMQRYSPQEDDEQWKIYPNQVYLLSKDEKKYNYVLRNPDIPFPFFCTWKFKTHRYNVESMSEYLIIDKDSYTYYNDIEFSIWGARGYLSFAYPSIFIRESYWINATFLNNNIAYIGDDGFLYINLKRRAVGNYNSDNIYTYIFTGNESQLSASISFDANVFKIQPGHECEDIWIKVKSIQNDIFSTRFFGNSEDISGYNHPNYILDNIPKVSIFDINFTTSGGDYSSKWIGYFSINKPKLLKCILSPHWGSWIDSNVLSLKNGIFFQQEIEDYSYDDLATCPYCSIIFDYSFDRTDLQKLDASLNIRQIDTLYDNYNYSFSRNINNLLPYDSNTTVSLNEQGLAVLGKKQIKTNFYEYLSKEREVIHFYIIFSQPILSSNIQKVYRYNNGEKKDITYYTREGTINSFDFFLYSGDAFTYIGIDFNENAEIVIKDFIAFYRNH